SREPDAPPLPDREFRAAWVATVANIDWPSRPGLPVAQQQQEARAILDRLVELNMNAVVFQVRPHADALYDSPLEPWSAYLTGAQGQAPTPYYDPLAFWIDEAHARGLQLHAWFNPYRANHPSNPGDICERSIVRARPELVVKLGNKGYWWMDPAMAEVQDLTTSVVMDVVRRYDIDGVHLDDYFYPYRSYHDGQDFPDDRSWSAYRASGGELARNDWRRRAVDTLIERLYREIKAAKPRVEFGISPFGIWRPGHPRGIQGLDQYDVLFADAKRWWNEGWVDYYSPQLYWPIAQVAQSFPVLLGWWRDQNRHGRHLWPGTSISRARGEAGAAEIVGHVMITRGMLPESPGVCMFSMK
ncbi:MAG: family 10 glycosylhydrolase, partial [Planctomycetes bacterium]|nr:family 10 glycosylhydrolase [Planctomycetota bacterium]